MFRFVRGDQYAIALGLLDNGKVVAGVLGCPNLPMESIANGVPARSSERVGCLFSASLRAGTTVESLDGSGQPQPVPFLIYHYVSIVVSEMDHETSF